MEQIEKRQIRVTKKIKTSPEQMWKAWTDPARIAQWWAPEGFTSTIHEMDFREGGEWKLTIHGPDGTNYPNRSVFKEIIPSKKIVFEHFNPHFIASILFTPAGGETEIDWTMLFDTVEMRETIVKAHKADEGLKQNVEKLERCLSKK